MSADRPDASPISVHEEIFPGDTNAYGTAFGGKILALMDRAAGLAASRFAHASFVTASLDALEFSAAVLEGEIAEVEAQVVYTSRHTCAVKVRVFAIDKGSWARRPCCHGTIFMVAMGADGKPHPVPQLSPDGAEARAAWDAAQEIHQRMLRDRRSV
jgi:acyl-CoA hydrolase